MALLRLLLLLACCAGTVKVTCSLPLSLSSSKAVTVYLTPGATDGPVNITSCSSTALLSSSSAECTLRSAVAYCLTILNATDDVCNVQLPPSLIEIDPYFGEIMLSSSEDSASAATGTLCILGTTASLVQPSYSPTNETRLFSFAGSTSSENRRKDLNFLFKNFSIAYFGNVTILGGAISMVNYNTGGSMGEGMAVAVFDSVLFRNNSGLVGGAVNLNNARNVMFNSSSFIGNYASRQGGGLYLEADNMLITISTCTFLDNQVGRARVEVDDPEDASSMGAGLSLEERNRDIMIQESVFYGNVAQRGGGIFLYRSNLFVVLERVLFLANVAFRGGGMYVGEKNHNLTLTACTFEDNVASQDGGGLRLFSMNERLRLDRCVFQSNRATYGAGLSLNDQNHHVVATQSLFLNNTALNFGGGVYVFESNDYAIFDNCTFVSNFATGGNAGAISFFKDNYDVRVVFCTFTENRAFTGGAVSLYGNNRRMKFQHCHFVLNFAAEDGGSLMVDNDNWYLEFLSCTFIGNHASDDGGAIHMFTKNKFVSVTQCVFRDNSASDDGGAFSVSTANDEITISESDFINNTAYGNGGGLRLYSGNYYATIRNCSFMDNNAMNGGALYLVAGNYYFEITSVIFEGNEASADGGGILVITDHFSFLVHLCAFINNEAVTGAGVHFALNIVNISITNSLFLDNLARVNGGALLVEENIRHIYIADCNFTNNYVFGYGGATYFGRAHVGVTFEYCLFEGNVALMGSPAMLLSYVQTLIIRNSIFKDNHAFYDSVGGISLFGGDGVILDNCIFDSNIAEITACGGCIAMQEMANMVLSNLLFLNNEALGNLGKGGAMCVKNSKGILMINVTMIGNRATLDGGALYVHTADIGRVTNSTFNGNSVEYGSGSAIFITKAEDWTLLFNSFRANQAFEGGGTVFWRDSLEPYGLRAGSNAFADDNVAAYGPSWATPAYELHVAVTEFNVSDFEGVIPSIAVDILDYYQQVVVIENLRFATAFALSASECNGAIGHLGGEKTKRFVYGTANFTHLEALCAPGHTLEMQIISNHYVNAIDVLVTFRTCERGEYSNVQICQACEQGYYSFVDPKEVSESFDLSQANVCEECPSPGVSECYKDQIILEEGYWRISPVSADIFECPLHKESCRGGAYTGEASCGELYKGPMCAVCTDGSHIVRSSRRCVACSAGSVWFDASFLFVLVCLFLAVILGGIVYQKLSLLGKDVTIDDFMVMLLIYCGQISTNNSPQDRISLMKEIRAKVFGTGKIYITLYQILNILPFVLDFQFPTRYTDVISCVSVLVFSLSGVATFTTCSFSTEIDSISRLYMDTIFLWFLWL